MKQFKCAANGIEKEINVRERVGFNELISYANYASKFIVSDNGEYSPWLSYLCSIMVSLTVFGDLVAPEDWKDDDYVEFWECGAKEILHYIDSTQFAMFNAWVKEKVENRLKTCQKNTIETIILELTESFKTLLTSGELESLLEHVADQTPVS